MQNDQTTLSFLNNKRNIQIPQLVQIEEFTFQSLICLYTEKTTSQERRKKRVV